MVGASDSQSVELEFIFPSQVITKDFKKWYLQLDAQHKRDCVENKLVSLLVVSLGKALNGMPPSLCGRQMSEAKQFTRHGGLV